jgi:hypothetical protein
MDVRVEAIGCLGIEIHGMPIVCGDVVDEFSISATKIEHTGIHRYPSAEEILDEDFPDFVSIFFQSLEADGVSPTQFLLVRHFFR